MGDSGPAHEVGTFSSREDDLHIGEILPIVHSRDCKTQEKFNFSEKKSKTVISVENQKFSRSRMTKRTAPLNSSREI